MKKRNKFFERHKEYMSLSKREDELLTLIRNQGYIELEKPIPHGWYKEFDLRDDIKRRS